MAYRPLTQTLTGTYTMADGMPQLQFLVPGGAGRTVLLPPVASSKGKFYILVNKTLAGENLTVKEATNTTTVGVIAPSQLVIFYCDGAVWYSGLDTAQGLIQPLPAFTSISTAGAVTFTAAQILSGVIVRDPNGAGRSDVLPTAALLVAALPGVAIGDTIFTHIINGADAAETITLLIGAGGTFDANQTAAAQVIPQFHSKILKIRFTNVTAAAEAYAACF